MEIEMNVLKHMEAVFLVALALVCTTTWAGHEMSELRATRAAQVAVQGSTKLAVVKVEGKRIAVAHRAG
jgi:hypothetical protein